MTVYDHCECIRIESDLFDFVIVYDCVDVNAAELVSEITDSVIGQWLTNHPKYKDMDLISALELEFELNDMKAEIYSRA